MADILIIDGDHDFSRALAGQMQYAGHKVAVVHGIEEGVAKASQILFDVVFLDVQLLDGSGLDALSELRTGLLPPEVIVLSSTDNDDRVAQAIQGGAWDVVGRDTSFQAPIACLTQALQYRTSRQPSIRPITLYSEKLIGHSPNFLAALGAAAQAAASDANVLITGETGTGKELFAAAIHENSHRAKGTFVVVDCSALPETLIGSTLFGHEKGAFTGAESARNGLVAEADGGTLFLDEVGDMPWDIQKAFLRVLQERRYRPIGSQQELESNFRIIAATHRDLDDLAARNLFRKDLLFRLRAVSVKVPPLRKRRDDIPLLAAHFVALENQKRLSDKKGVNEHFYEALQNYSWPGNVRELAQAVSSAVATADADLVLFPNHLPQHIRIHLARVKTSHHTSPCRNDNENEPDTKIRLAEGTLLPYREMRMEFERAYLEALIRMVDHNIEMACRIAQLSRPHIYALLRKHDLKL